VVCTDDVHHAREVVGEHVLRHLGRHLRQCLHQKVCRPLPLLQAQVVTPGRVTNETFLAGYGLAQAVPGPIFTFAAYLGAVMGPPPNGLAGAVIALVALLLPGMLLVYGMLPFWDALRTRPAAQAAMRGTNAPWSAFSALPSIIRSGRARS
jgi:Chromate transporter